MSLLRAVIDALLPEGQIWAVEDGADLDALFDGLADSLDADYEYLADLARLRNPLLTPILDDLENEYGLSPNASLTEETRRARLLAAKTARSSDGTLEFLQDTLQLAGFNVTVYANYPPVNPALFVTFDPSVIFGNEDALFNGTGALFGGARGYLLVNGPVYENQQLVEYESPADPGYWPLVFFIGGAATRTDEYVVSAAICGNASAICGTTAAVASPPEPNSGAITQIETVEIPISRKEEFNRLIVKFKPMFSWAGVVVNFV